jgi:hypothetical protein
VRVRYACQEQNPGLAALSRFGLGTARRPRPPQLQSIKPSSGKIKKPARRHSLKRTMLSYAATGG